MEKIEVQEKMPGSSLRYYNTGELIDTNTPSVITAVRVVGGNNGMNDWEDYFRQLADSVGVLAKTYNVDKKQVVLHSIETDILDDIFYALFYIY